MSSSVMSIRNQCEKAINAIKDILTDGEYSECVEYISKYGEYLLGLEFAIDWINEDDRKINDSMYNEFHKAYTLMGLDSDPRLFALKSLVSHEDGIVVQ